MSLLLFTLDPQYYATPEPTKDHKSKLRSSPTMTYDASGHQYLTFPKLDPSHSLNPYNLSLPPPTQNTSHVEPLLEPPIDSHPLNIFKPRQLKPIKERHQLRARSLGGIGSEQRLALGKRRCGQSK
jgi:hypothetical protein